VSDAEIKSAIAVLRQRESHTRFHEILNAQAHALAVLATAHLTASTHDRYDVCNRIHAKRFDSWSSEALAEVMSEMGAYNDD
jgi:hypothetical protein